jgi:hypothetical protein
VASLVNLFDQTPTAQPATSLRINTSVQGVPIALHLGGAQRLAGNLIDYYNLVASNYNGPGGKGGTLGSVFKGSGNYAYTVSFILGLCEGPVNATTSLWYNGSGVPASAGGFNIWNLPQTLDGTNTVAYELYLGDYEQTVWGNTETQEPSHGFGYRGICYAGFSNFPLGGSTSLPNINVEVVSANCYNVVPGQVDGDPSIALESFLTNPYWGLGFPANRLGSLLLWQSYCIALGFGVSPVIASPIAASAFVNDLTAATNSAPCWQDGEFTVVPYGDSSVTAGQIQTITETYNVPQDQEGADSNNTPLYFPHIQVSFFASFAGDGGVTYLSGAPLQKVSTYAPTGYPTSGTPAQGQYVEQGGVYYFNPGDINAGVLITYNYAATASYVPNTSPLYAFTLDDFLPNQGTLGTGLAVGNSPLICVRKSRDQMLNDIKVEYLDRNNQYNPVDIEVKDEASIVAFGRIRPSNIKQLHFFCLAEAAQQSATLSLIRQQIARTFQWTCGRHFMPILELMALVTVTDEGQGLFEQPVRITEIYENQDFSLTVTAEEYLGTVSAPLYGTQPSLQPALNYNADPGPINIPIIFEPTDELAATMVSGAGLLIAGAVSGQNPEQWGGCYVWVSYDGENYTRLPGQINGNARMGVTTADLPAVTPNPTGAQTIDESDTLSVSLVESDGTLSSGTVLDATSLNTRCLIGNEVIAYETATLTGPNAYNLTYLVRGAYGTENEIVNHPAGTPFARLDDNIFVYPYDQSRIGSTIYLKFQSFNNYQGGLESLADVPAYPYVITGAALASPLPPVTNLRTVYDVNSGFTELDWDEVEDFRTLQYEIRSGSSPTAAITLGTVAHPPFRVPGNGTYWVAAVSTPVAGLTVYSETWEDIEVAGAVITQNVILTIDLKALNWPGVFTGGAGVDSTLNAIRTGGGNILSDSNILTTPDILEYGGGSSGEYFPSNVAFLDIGYVANASVSIAYQPTGVPAGQNILTIGDFLNTPDILGSASTQFITVYPLINTATAESGDLYQVGDLYQYPDLYTIGDYNWAGWQRFSPGTYQARALDFAMILDTVDPNTIAYDLEFAITITIPSRVDTYPVTTSSSASTTITFEPTGASSSAPFNGGAGPGDLPAITWGIINAQAGDDLIISSLSLSAITFAVWNAGSKVVRNVNLFATGY